MPFVSSVRGNYAVGKRRAFDTSSKVLVTGGTITTAGGYRIHTFTTTGSSTFDTSGVGGAIDVEYLVVGGGAGGMNGLGGGGGAGGMRTGSLNLAQGPQPVVVGAGGPGLQVGGHTASNPTGNGNPSTFSTIVSTGGGTGGGFGVAMKICIDCRFSGGTVVKPSFW